MLGLDFSGKTTILNKIKHKESVRTAYGVGFYVEILFYMGLIKIVSWDLGEASGMRKLYKPYYPNTDGIIFINDSNDKERFNEAIECFQDILKADELKNCPIHVFLNRDF